MTYELNDAFNFPIRQSHIKIIVLAANGHAHWTRSGARPG